MPILSAGYIIDEVAACLQQEERQSWLDQLVLQTDFELQCNREGKESNDLDATWSVVNNLISRGVLTRCPFDSALHILQYIFDRRLSLTSHQGYIRMGSDSLPFQNLGQPAVEPEFLTWQEAYASEATFAWSTLLFSPILIARIQKAIIHLIGNGLLDLQASSWRLLLVERDVPGAALAISELQRLIATLHTLKGEDPSLPPIHLRVVASSEETATGFSNPELLVSAESCRVEDYDAVLDVAAFVHELPPLFPTTADILYVSVKPQADFSAVKPETKFHFHEPINYLSTNEQESQIAHQPGQAIEDALSFLLKNLFRSADDPVKLLPVLTAAFSDQNRLIWDSSSHRRNLAQVLVALLQPAYSIWVCPEEWDRIRQEEFLAFHRIGAYLLRRKEEYPNQNGLFSSRSLLSVKPPNFFTQETEIEESSKRLVRYVFIQDAHKVSPWSPTYHVLYPTLWAKLQTFLPHAKIFPTTGLLTYDILRDINRYFHLSFEGLSQEVIEQVERDYVTYKVVPVSFRSSSALSKNPRKGISMVKFPLIRRILKNISFELPGAGSSLRGMGLVYMGDDTASEITEDLKKYLESEKMTVSVFERLNRASDIVLTQAQEQNPVSILPIRYTIHFQYPDRLENLYVETDIPISPQQATNSYIIFRESAGGLTHEDANESSSLSLSTPTTKGARILQELFEEITYPEDFFATYLESKLSKITGEELKVRFTFERHGEGSLDIYAYVSVASTLSYQQKRVARIGLSDLSVHIDAQGGIDTEQVTRFAEAAISILHKFHPQNEWVDSTLQFVGKGITTILEEEQDNTISLTLSYKNNAMVQLVDLIRTEGNFELAFEEVQDQYYRTDSFSSFTEGLEKHYDTFSLSEESIGFAGELYAKIRERRDTLFALAQLEHMGLIDSIELEDDLEVCHIHFSQKEEGHYEERFKQFIRYHGGVDVEKKWMERLYFDEEQLSSSKIAQEFNRFSIEYFSIKRKNSLPHSFRAMKWGLEKGSQGIQEYIKHYFFSLYALTDFLPKSLEEENSPTVLLKKYLGYLINTPSILDVGSSWSNLMHLASSCHILLGREGLKHSNLLQVLQSFARLGLAFESEEEAGRQKEKGEADRKNLIEGMLALHKGADIEIREWTEVLDKMGEVADSIHPDFGRQIRETQDIFLASYYSHWLTSFNRKFIDAQVLPQ